jgi:HEPN domain-containing protein
MDKFEHSKYWIKSAEHDLETAESLFKSEKYDWCLFICHIIIEKGLKAVYVLKHDNSIPPKIHNLVRLAELSEIELAEDKIDLLDHINDFNIEARYPDYKFSFYTTCTKEYTEGYFKKIKEMFIWIKSLIPLNQ